MDAVLILLGVLCAGVGVHATRLIVRFNRRLPQLWELLETRERGHRVREVRDEPLTNLPSTRYLYDRVDFEEPEIRELKLALRREHRNALGTLLVFIAS